MLLLWASSCINEEEEEEEKEDGRIVRVVPC